MRSGIQWTRYLVAVFTVCGLLLSGMPGAVSAQDPPGTGKPPQQHKWKHDKVKAPGPPCLKADRPCPPGQSGGTPPGHQNLVAGVTFTPGFEPTATFAGAVTALRDGTLLTVRPVPVPAQQAVFDVFGTDGEAAGATLVGALTSRGNEGARDQALHLVEALRTLTVQDGQLPRTVEAFNAFVDASSGQFLEDPAPEFLVVHAFIGALVEEAVAADSGTR